MCIIYMLHKMESRRNGNMKNAFEWLENTVSLFEDKPIYCDENSSVSFEEVFDKARRIGTASS